MNEKYQNELMIVQDENDIVKKKLKELEVNREDLNMIYHDQRVFFDELLSNENSEEFNRELNILNSEIIMMQNQSIQKLEEYEDELKHEKRKLDLKEELFEEYKNSENRGNDNYVN